MTCKKILLLIAAIGIVGCESDIDVYREGNPLPVAYCILNQDSNTQNLRISRSYSSYRASDPPGSPDSLLFERALEAVIEEVDGDKVVKRVFFKPVEIQKDEGFFPYTEHWIYTAEINILPDTDYKLIIYLDEIDKIVYATCTTVTPFDILNPAYPEVRQLSFQTNHNPQFYWTKSKNGALYQLGFTLNYLEITDDRIETKELDIFLNTIFKLESSGHFFSQSINSAQFYINLAGQLKPDPAVIRQCISADAFIFCAGEELAYLVRLQEEGQSFSLMEFSNVYNGIGVFSSRIMLKNNGFELTGQTIDSLAYGRYTHTLNFLDKNGVREGGDR